MLEICEIYGWTYQDYYSQPQEFTNLAIEKLKAKRKLEAQQNQK